MFIEPNYIREFKSERGVRVIGTDEGDALVIGAKLGVHNSGTMSRDELVELRDWINELLEVTE